MGFVTTGSLSAFAYTHALHLLPAQVRQAQAQYEALQRACEAEVARLQKDLSAAMEAMLHHRMALRAVLERTHGEVTHVLGGQAGWGA